MSCPGQSLRATPSAASSTSVRTRYGYRGTLALVLTSAISILQSARPPDQLSRVHGEFSVFAIAARLRVLTRVRYPFCLSQNLDNYMYSGDYDANFGLPIAEADNRVAAGNFLYLGVCVPSTFGSLPARTHALLLSPAAPTGCSPSEVRPRMLRLCVCCRACSPPVASQTSFTTRSWRALAAPRALRHLRSSFLPQPTSLESSRCVRAASQARARCVASTLRVAC